jgi:hypothetical protein
MKPSEIKKRMIRSLDSGNETPAIFQELEEGGVDFDFSQDFNDKVLSRLSAPEQSRTREVEFIRSMNHAFYRIALTGVAAIVLMLISIFLMEGSLSFNSFLGLGNSYDETTICLLTGK